MPPIIGLLEVQRQPMRKKRKIMPFVYVGLVVLLFVVLYVLNQSNRNALYDKPVADLNPATRELLKDPNYQNIILPDELDRKIADKESFFVYFFSATCPFCIQTTPKLTPIIGEVGVDVKQFNLDVFDEGYGKYNIIYTPTLVFFENGVEKERIEGGIVEGNDTITEETYRSFFERYKEAASS